MRLVSKIVNAITGRKVAMWIFSCTCTLSTECSVDGNYTAVIHLSNLIAA